MHVCALYTGKGSCESVFIIILVYSLFHRTFMKNL